MVFTRLTDLFLMIIIAVCLKNEVITGNLCEDKAALHNTTSIKMCEDGNVTSTHVVLDTHDSKSTGETICTCSVANLGAVHVLAAGDEINPNTTDCGSKITVLDDNTNRTYECEKFPALPLAIRSFSIIWEMMAPGDSKYCLNITSFVHFLTNLTVVCQKPSKMVIETTDSTSSSTSHKYDTSAVLETTGSTSPSTLGICNVSTSQNVSSSPANNTSDSLTTNVGIPSTSTVSSVSLEKCVTDDSENCLPVYVLVLTNTIAYLIAIMAAVGNYIYFRRYMRKMENRASESTTGTMNGVAGAGYEDLQPRNISQNNYEEVTGGSGGNTYSNITQ